MKKSMKIAVICSSNMNRSMEAHAYLSKRGYDVKSFGTGDKIRLPAQGPQAQNVYEFGTTYEEILADLEVKDKSYYTEKGLLNIVNRNRRIKPGPERFQESEDIFDLLITCEERVYDQVLQHFETRSQTLEKPVHLINIDIKDNPEEATFGSFLISDIVKNLETVEDLENDIGDIICNLEDSMEKRLLHSILFY